MPEADTIDRRIDTGTKPDAPRQALVVREDMRWLEIPRDQLVETLRTSLFPGAKPESINAVLNYCEAAGLNVMLKPVHIVPMGVKEGSQWKTRDVIMPGINHYRVQASRTGQCLGKTAPEWGPDTVLTFGDYKITVPEWCRITVKRLVGGQVAEFTAQEYWEENYATKGRDSTTPNAMWQKRPRGQLHKCAEAQAWRMAFPELDSGNTAEEMEGKVIDLTPDQPTPGRASKSLDAFSGQPQAEPEDAEVEDVADGEPDPEDRLIDEMPAMPKKEMAAWVGPKHDWKPGWEWLNKKMPLVTQEVRQQLAVEHHNLLWAVYTSDVAKKGPYSKAAQEFGERWHLVIPAPTATAKEGTDNGDQGE